jgi:hypothetical protein
MYKYLTVGCAVLVRPWVHDHMGGAVTSEQSGKGRANLPLAPLASGSRDTETRVSLAIRVNSVIHHLSSGLYDNAHRHHRSIFTTNVSNHRYIKNAASYKFIYAYWTKPSRLPCVGCEETMNCTHLSLTCFDLNFY